MTELSTEQKRILLAEWAGYVRGIDGYMNPCWCKNREFITEPPSYFTSLDAVAELEARLMDEEHIKWAEHLLYITKINTNNLSLLHHPTWQQRCLALSLFASATAAQRAEAIGITLGLWK